MGSVIPLVERTIPGSDTEVEVERRFREVDRAKSENIYHLPTIASEIQS